jgi:DNA-directed RNA polymerase sigma subunit (sigma70/sigma32)
VEIEMSELRPSDLLVEELLRPLDDLERRVMIARYFGGGAPRTIEEVANVLGIQTEDVVLAESSALSKLPSPESGWPGSDPNTK